MSSVLTALTRTPPGPGILSGKVSKGGKQLSPGGRCEASTCCGPLGGQRLCLAVPLRGDSQQLLSSGDFSCRQDTVTEWTVSLLSCTCQWGDRTQKCFGKGQTGTVTGSEALHPRPQPPHSAPSLASLVVSLQPPWAARPPPSAPPFFSSLSALQERCLPRWPIPTRPLPSPCPETAWPPSPGPPHCPSKLHFQTSFSSAACAIGDHLLLLGILPSTGFQDTLSAWCSSPGPLLFSPLLPNLHMSLLTGALCASPLSTTLVPVPVSASLMGLNTSHRPSFPKFTSPAWTPR